MICLTSLKTSPPISKSPTHQSQASTSSRCVPATFLMTTMFYGYDYYYYYATITSAAW
jgi:hypothetical protein